MQKFVALRYISLSALPSNISKSTELCKGFSWGSAVTQWSYAGRGLSCHTNIGQNTCWPSTLWKKNYVQLIFHNLISVGPRMKLVGPPYCITNTSNTSNTGPLLSQTSSHWPRQWKKRGLPQNSPVSLELSKRERERAQSRESVSYIAMEQNTRSTCSSVLSILWSKV